MFKLNISPRTEKLINKMVNAHKKANPFRYRDPEKYHTILNEYYKEEIVRRTNMLSTVQSGSNEEKITKIKQIYQHIGRRENIIDTMVDWAWTYNPQNLAIGLPTFIPMVPWWRQVELIEWIYEHTYGTGRLGGIVKKSRETAVTWTFVIVMVQEWRWTYGYAGGVGSNKFEGVDKRDDPRCVFEKIRAYLKRLPRWWFPEGWNWAIHDKVGNLVNPENSANISGEGGKQIGRGGRTLQYLNDEKASFEFPNQADAALSYNTKAQFDISTFIGPNEFYQKCNSGKYDVFSMSWRDDPRKDEEWYENEKRNKSEEIIAQELDMNPLASVGGIQIRPEWVEAAFKIELKPTGPICSALDVAAGGTNKSALCVRMGPVFRVEEWDIPNGIDLTNEALDHSDKADVDWFSFDEIGVGHAVESAIERTEREIKYPCYGLNAGSKPSDMFYPEFNRKGHEIFADARSEWWYLLEKRLERTWEHMTGKRTHADCDMIDLERDEELKAQICSPLKMTTTTGKRKTESKKDMLARGIKSPDQADSLVMSSVPRDAGRKHVIEQEIKTDTVDIAWGSIPRHQCRHYAAVCQLKDLSIEVICVIWHEVYAHLAVYDEMIFKMPNPALIAQNLKKRMKLDQFEVDRIIGNPRMFAEEKRSPAKEINKALWDLTHYFQTVKVKQPRKYDQYGSVIILNELIRRNKFTVDKKCVHFNRQINSWRLDHGEVREEGMKEGILMIMSELIKIVPFKEILKFKEYVTHLK